MEREDTGKSPEGLAVVGIQNTGSVVGRRKYVFHGSRRPRGEEADGQVGGKGGRLERFPASRLFLYLSRQR